MLIFAETKNIHTQFGILIGHKVKKKKKFQQENEFED
jgi:hypothetical protein